VNTKAIARTWYFALAGRDPPPMLTGIAGSALLEADLQGV
jgi:hypothetical protein